MFDEDEDEMNERIEITDEEYDASSLHLSMMELENMSCRWPVAGEKADMRFCGHPVQAGGAMRFCRHHARRAVAPSRRGDL